ncbi:MAG: hypothetical protein PHZ19_07840 [Candidatus Thermoplasmatota archaeon]|nr:hypothetical protein [Candidatus Thermoplasmatota archaeon]
MDDRKTLPSRAIVRIRVIKEGEEPGIPAIIKWLIVLILLVLLAVGLFSV